MVLLKDEEKGAEARLPVADIANAKLIVTDDLIAASLAGRAVAAND